MNSNTVSNKNSISRNIDISTNNNIGSSRNSNSSKSSGSTTSRSSGRACRNKGGNRLSDLYYFCLFLSRLSLRHDCLMGVAWRAVCTEVEGAAANSRVGKLKAIGTSSAAAISKPLQNSDLFQSHPCTSLRLILVCSNKLDKIFTCFSVSQDYLNS